MRLFRSRLVVAFCNVLFLMAGMASAGASQQPTELQAEEEKAYELIRQRFIKHKSWLTWVSFSVIHAGTEANIKDGAAAIQFLASLEEPEQVLKIVRSEGFAPFKDRVRNLLTNRGPIVRGYGAIWLFVIADTEFKKDIARLLDEKPGGLPDSDLERLVHNKDRCIAARVLGEMGATEYAPTLLALLGSSDANDRIGALQGLGLMRLKEQAKEIAKLLSDEDSDVQTAAIQTLAELDATEYAADIAQVLTSRDSIDVPPTAMYALVRLNGKKWIKDVASLLESDFHKSDAATALALFGAKEYTPMIARLLDDNNALVRCDAAIAIGILDAQEYKTQIAAHLADQEEFVRAYAAVALLLMSDPSNSNEILEVIHAEWKVPELASIASDPAAYFGARIGLDSILEQRQQQLTLRAVENWEQINPAHK